MEVHLIFKSLDIWNRFCLFMKLEELRADIVDLKEMYREQVNLLVNKVFQFTKLCYTFLEQQLNLSFNHVIPLCLIFTVIFPPYYLHLQIQILSSSISTT